MIGDKTPNMKLKDCEAVRPKTLSWKCPYTGLVEFEGKFYCANHAKEAGWPQK